MISSEQVESGWSHGVPGRHFPGFETRVTENGWVQAKLPIEVLSELVRTPDFITWQGAVWLFRGAEPMIYIGEWKKQDFEERCPAGTSPGEYFKEVVQDTVRDQWIHADSFCIYVFRDRVTGAHAAYYDMD
jgi:uncharacterized protein CbrC (UPF0167 family)